MKRLITTAKLTHIHNGSLITICKRIQYTRYIVSTTRQNVFLILLETPSATIVYMREVLRLPQRFETGAFTVRAVSSIQSEVSANIGLLSDNNKIRATRLGNKILEN